MKLKANLHLHSGEDRKDVLDYSIFDAIDAAGKLGFSILAWTPHDNVLCEKQHIKYAAGKGILLLPGIEKKIKGREVLIINADKDAEKIKTFFDLKIYKERRGDVLIGAPHPFFPSSCALRKKLLENLEVFDFLEKSWFYLLNIDFNKKTAKIAKEFKKNFIATSDTHDLRYLDNSYCVIEAEKNAESVLAALRTRRFENFFQPISLWTAWRFYYKIVLRPKVIFTKILRMFKK
jgi:hypothetical protein